jgi:hypothetical protein
MLCAHTAIPGISLCHAVRVLADLSSIAQVQGYDVGRSGGQQLAASTAVLYVRVAPPHRRATRLQAP